MTSPQRIIVHFGNEEHTTGHHVVRALRQLDIDATCEGAGHRSPRAGSDDGTPLLWVESGRPSFPTPQRLENRFTAAWLIDTHRGMDWRGPFGAAFDVCFAAQRRAIDDLRRHGADAEWLPLASPRADGGMPHRDRPIPAAFVGFAPAGSRRQRILDGLAARTDLDCNRAYVSPHEMIARYERARVVVNIPLAGDLNMRVFEAAGAGSFVVTGPMDGLDAILAPDLVALVDSDDPAVWADAVNGALADPTVPDRAARAAAIVRDKHTYLHRARRIRDAMGDAHRRAIPFAYRRDALLTAAVARRDLRDAARMSGRSPRGWARFAGQLVPAARDVIRRRVARRS